MHRRSLKYIDNVIKINGAVALNKYMRNCVNFVGADAHIRPDITGRCGHRPLHQSKSYAFKMFNVTVPLYHLSKKISMRL